jgi:hypothetical protein
MLPMLDPNPNLHALLFARLHNSTVHRCSRDEASRRVTAAARNSTSPAAAAVITSTRAQCYDRHSLESSYEQTNAANGWNRMMKQKSLPTF